MASVNLVHLDAWDPESGGLNVVIETAQGSRNKFKYNPEKQLFELAKVLPAGMVFPFDFGFIPATLGEDGDPLDVLVLMDEPAFPGCRISCRLIGVIEAEQTEDGETERNDRLIAIAEESHDHRDIHSLKQVNEHLLREIEYFFVSYNKIGNKEFKPLSHHGPRRSEEVVKKGMKRFRKEQDEKSNQEQNGASHQKMAGART